MKTVYLGLGSNLGNREDALQQAITALQSDDLRIGRVSGVYETSPQDRTDQPWFLNLVAEAETDLLPVRLLLRTSTIERRLGRKRSVPKGPRTLDIDILLYGGAVVDCPQLVIPHPEMHRRRFVLEPLAELAPELRHPVSMRSVREMLAGVAGQQVRRIEWRPVVPER
jgi:2-amino-4-hydroxy-6-hydroxymethyldihydropteridine diphosphokinase